MHGHRVELRAAEVITPVQCLHWHLVRVRFGDRVREGLGLRLGLGLGAGLGLGGGLGSLVQGRRLLTMCILCDLGRHQSVAHIVSTTIVIVSRAAP